MPETTCFAGHKFAYTAISQASSIHQVRGSPGHSSKTENCFIKDLACCPCITKQIKKAAYIMKMESREQTNGYQCNNNSQGLIPVCFFKRGRKMRDGRITQHHRNVGNAKSFFVQKIAGMFHTLALVKIKNGSTE